MDREARACDEGEQAFKDGFDSFDNPYDIYDTHEWGRANAWMLGYREAERSVDE